MVKRGDGGAAQARQAGFRLVQGHVSEDPFAAAFKATRMPMIVTDPNQHDNPIIYCNAAFLKLTGYSDNEVIGRNAVSSRDPRLTEKPSTRSGQPSQREQTLRSTS